LGIKLLLSLVFSVLLLVPVSLNQEAYAGGGFSGTGLDICNQIPVPTDDEGEPTAMTYSESDGLFYWANFDNLYNMTASGEKVFIGNMPESMKGLAFVGGTLYGADRSGDLLFEIDPSDASSSANKTVTLAGNFVDGFKGLATDPTTDILYALIKDDNSNSGLILATIVPSTGVATEIAPLTFNSFGSLAFTANGDLFATTGFNQGILKSFFEINKTTGNATFDCHFGGGGRSAGDGQAMAFNPDNGFLYTDIGESFAKQNGTVPACTTTDIPMSGDASRVSAMTWSADEAAFLWTTTGRDFATLTSGGTFTQLADLQDGQKGLAFMDGTLYGLESFGDNLNEIDPNVPGTFVSSQAVIVGGVAVDRGYGLATDPTTGILWGLADLANDEVGRDIFTINPDTAIGTLVGNTGDRFASIAFDASGTMFGVTGDGAGSGAVLFILSKTNGSADAFCALRDSGGNGGHAIALNPDDSLLYHGSSDDDFEKITGVGAAPSPPRTALFSIERFGPILAEIDPLTGDIIGADILNSEFPVLGGTALASLGGNTLYGVLSDGSDFDDEDSRRLAMINPNNGDTTDIGALSDAINGIAFKNGILFGVTARNNPGPAGVNALVTINTSTAEVTKICDITTDVGTSSPHLGFNPTDGYLYYGVSSEIFKLDMQTCELGAEVGANGGGVEPLALIYGYFTNVLMPDFIPQAEAGGGCGTRAMTWYSAINEFLVSGFGDFCSYNVDTGVFTFIGSANHNSKGMAFNKAGQMAIGGEIIPLDSTMILAAGAQYTAAWMIPVIVSAIGIAIVIARKF